VLLGRDSELVCWGIVSWFAASRKCSWLFASALVAWIKANGTPSRSANLEPSASSELAFIVVIATPTFHILGGVISTIAILRKTSCFNDGLRASYAANLSTTRNMQDRLQ
jgi:hypothetical protein